MTTGILSAYSWEKTLRKYNLENLDLQTENLIQSFRNKQIIVSLCLLATHTLLAGKLTDYY